MSPLILTDSELPEQIMSLLGDTHQIRVWQKDETDPGLLAEAEAFLVYGHPTLAGGIMDRMPNLRVISNFGVGVDHIDLADAKERGIPVGNTPGFVDGATADMTWALLMAVARNVVTGDRYARGPEFVHYDPNILHGFEIHGSTLGIVGMGAIGTQVARRARGFDMSVLYHNRHRNEEAEKAVDATYVELAELLNRADFVTLNVPMTPETRNLISRSELKQMKPTAYLINMARGGVVDHDALLEALSEGWIAGAALDVTEPEPLPRDHPLLQLENLVIAPHLGSATRQTRQGMAERTVENLLAGLHGEPMPSRVA